MEVGCTLSALLEVPLLRVSCNASVDQPGRLCHRSGWTCGAGEVPKCPACPGQHEEAGPRFAMPNQHQSITRMQSKNLSNLAQNHFQDSFCLTHAQNRQCCGSTVDEPATDLSTPLAGQCRLSRQSRHRSWRNVQYQYLCRAQGRDLARRCAWR